MHELPQARALRAGWSAPGAGLALIFWGLLLGSAIGIANQLWFRYLLDALYFGADELGASLDSARRDHLLDLLELSSTAGTVVFWATMVAVLTGLVLYARAPRDLGVRALASVAAAAVACALAAYVGEVVYMRLASPEQMASSQRLRQTLWLVGSAGEATCMLLLLAAMARASARLGRRLPTATLIGVATLVLALELLYPLVRAFALDGWRFPTDHPWIYTAVYLPFDLARLGGLLWLLHRHRRALRAGAAAPAEGPAWLQWPGWETSSRGLRLYAAAIAWRLAILVLGVLALFFAYRARSVAAARFLMWAIPVAGLVASGFALAGLAKYAFVPNDTGGRPTALAGLTCSALAVCVDLIGLLLVLSALTSRDLGAVAALGERLSIANGLGQGLGLTSLLVLLASFRRVGHFIGLDLAGRTWATSALVGVAALVVVGARAATADRGMAVSDALGLSLLGLLLALVAVVMYLAIARDLARAIDERTRLPRSVANRSTQ